MFAPVEIDSDLRGFRFDWKEVHDKMGLKGEELPFEYMERNMAEFGSSRRIHIRPSEQGIGIEFREGNRWVEKVSYNFDNKSWEANDLAPRETIAVVGFLSAFRCHLADGQIRPVLRNLGNNNWAFEWQLTQKEFEAISSLRRQILHDHDHELYQFLNKVKTVIYDATPIVFDFSLSSLTFFLNNKRIGFSSGSAKGWVHEQLVDGEVDLLTTFICLLLTTAERHVRLRGAD